ncbi:MAG: hypothetical protein ABI581_12590 [Sediminibacterium sp.]
MTTVTFCEHELKEWKESIDFFCDELIIFTRRLQEVAGKNSHKPLMSNVEHFQNQFILQKENFDIFRHEIHEQSDRIRNGSKNENRLTDQTVIKKQALLREQVRLAEKIFIELKHSFCRFLSKVL